MTHSHFLPSELRRAKARCPDCGNRYVGYALLAPGSRRRDPARAHCQYCSHTFELTSPVATNAVADGKALMAHDRPEPYYSIIDQHLALRGQRTDDFAFDPCQHHLNYEVRMASDLQTAINERAVTPVSLTTVLQQHTTACGHVGYHRQLAWLCHELAQGVRSPVTVSA